MFPKLITVIGVTLLALLPYLLAKTPNESRRGTLTENYLGSVDGKSYYAETEARMSWRFALGHCRAFGMELATITSEAQRDLLGSAFNFTSFYQGYWTAGRDAQRITQFVWDLTRETPDESLLKLGVMPSLQSCLVYYTHENPNQGDYHATACTREFGVLCEKIDGKE